MIRIPVLLLCWAGLSSFQAIYAQTPVTLNGYVRDAANGEELIGVTIYLPALENGTTTNSYGFYSITVPAGEYEVNYSYVGFTTEVIKLNLVSDLSKNVELHEESTMMDEIVVQEKAYDANVTDLQMSKNTLNIAQVKKLPALFGEVDIIKNIQMLPGVITAGEGTSAFYVRGGSADQNLILIDEAPVYDPSHLFGLFSVFNADVIKESELYKGGIPPRFGGRLSSILEVRTIDGNNKEFHGRAGIGTLASRVMVEGPIRKEESSYIFSARRSYADLFMRAAGEDDNLVHFYDVNAKINWRHNNNNRVFLAFYAGRDVFKIANEVGFSWGNATGTLRWNHLFNERLFSNTTFILSNFDYALEFLDPVQGLKWTSNLQELSLKQDMAYFINLNNELTFGFQLTGRRFAPGIISPTSSASIFAELSQPKMYALDHNIYINNAQKLSERVTLDYGVRFSVFQQVGKADVFKYEDPQDNVNIVRTDTLHYGAWKTVKVYPNIEPRVSLRLLLNGGQSLKFSYNRMVQNTHLISSGTVPVPFNTWNPSGYYLKPQLADQIAVGYFRNLKNNMYELSTEAYYKTMQNVTDFADNAELFFNSNLSTEFRQGEAEGYGLEFMINKVEGKLTGMVSYTWSKATRLIPGVNNGNRFYANHDRRNAFNVSATYDFNEKWAFGGNFIYTTGRPLTISSGKYEFDTYNLDVITERNGYRLPDYHRLDLSATLTPLKNKGRRVKANWVFSIYNVYNRKNPFTIYTRTKQDSDGNIIGDGTQKEARMIYLFPILASVTYNIKF